MNSTTSTLAWRGALAIALACSLGGCASGTSSSLVADASKVSKAASGERAQPRESSVAARQKAAASAPSPKVAKGQLSLAGGETKPGAMSSRDMLKLLSNGELSSEDVQAVIAAAALRPGGLQNMDGQLLSAFSQAGTRNHRQVKSYDLNVAALPSATIPKPFKLDDAPDALPSSMRNPDELELQNVTEQTPPTAIYIRVKPVLGRIQMGNITAASHGMRAIPRQCSDRDGVVPMRWMTLTRKAGEVLLQVTDGWFSHRDCKVAVMRDTYVKPMSTLGGLMWAFRTRCETCSDKDWMVLLTPQLNLNQHHAIGSTASVTSGNLSMVRVPLRRGGAVSLSAQIPRHALAGWETSLKLKVPVKESERNNVRVGLELMQTAAERSPTAILYLNSMSQADTSTRPQFIRLTGLESFSSAKQPLPENMDFGF